MTKCACIFKVKKLLKVKYTIIKYNGTFSERAQLLIKCQKLYVLKSQKQSLNNLLFFLFLSNQFCSYRYFFLLKSNIIYSLMGIILYYSKLQQKNKKEKK